MRSAFTFAAGLLLLCFLCAPPFSSADESSPVELEKIDSSAIINRDMAVLEDPKGVLTPEEIISPAVQERFKLMTGNDRLAAGEHVAVINGTNLHYHVHGKGPVCIVHPGGGFGWEYMSMPEVEKFLTLVYFEPVGSGSSDRLSKMEDYTLERYGADLEEFRRFLGLEKFCLVGHSGGGMVAQAYAVTHSGNLSKLVLYGTYPNGSWMRDLITELKPFENKPWFPEALQAFGSVVTLKTDDGEKEAFKKAFRCYYADYDSIKAEADRFHERMRYSIFPLQAVFLVQMPEFDLTDKLGQIYAPTLIVVGDTDPSVGPKYRKIFTEGIPNSKLVVIPRAGHFAHFEKPEAFAAALREFME